MTTSTTPSARSGAEVPTLEWCVDAALIDGAAVRIRPLNDSDRQSLHDFYAGLSRDSVRMRFFSAAHHLTGAELDSLVHSDPAAAVHLGVFHAGAVIGIGEYITTGPGEAEVSFTVSDAIQGRGIGSLLLEYLAVIARAAGITHFVAHTLADNARMRSVFRYAGFVEKVSAPDGGVVTVRLDISDTSGVLVASGERDRIASVAAVERMLRPRSIAVIGAGRRRGNVGHEILRNLMAGPFNGRLYPVNNAADNVCGVPAYASIADVPGTADLAVVVVPAPGVLDVVEECGRAGVASLVIISSGFAEAGPDGAALERSVLAAARHHGMRVVGPNCMGIINTDADVAMDATFAPTQPRPGNVAFFTQSGALGIAILDEAERLGMGLSSFVSAGNKADLSGNDLLQFWEQDERTDVVLLYLESFGNPRRFGEIARRVSRRKPIVVVKGGRSSAGARAASSHTAALASPETSVDALFRQSGIIRVTTLAQLFDTGRVLANAPLPAGNRVAVVGNAGGAGILTADACEAGGLTLPELSAETVAQLSALLPPAAALRNPVDMTAMAGPAEYAAALDIVLADPGIDSVIGIFVPPLTVDAAAVAAAIAEVAARAPKPVLATVLGDAYERLRGTRGLPVFAFPEDAAYALGAAASYAEWRRRDGGDVVVPDGTDLGAARAIVRAALEANGHNACQLDPAQAHALMRAIGVTVPRLETAATAGAAVSRAGEIGYPVALKAAGADLVHKSDSGGVALNLRTAAEVERAFTTMAARLGARMDGVAVQAMAPAGVETIVGVVRDRHFGPLVVFGSGGTAVELSGDQAFRATPLTDVDVHELVREPRGAPLLFGYRGSEPCDVAALESLIQRIGALVTAVPEIAEMDLNPVIAGPTGVTAVDVKVRVEYVPRDPLPGARRLRGIGDAADM